MPVLRLYRHVGDTPVCTWSYYEHNSSYNDRGATVTTNYVMRVSSNGQVSIPAEARARWNADRVVVVDLGDRVVLRPLPAEPVDALRGKYRRVGASSDRMRQTQRADDAVRQRRR